MKWVSNALSSTARKLSEHNNLNVLLLYLLLHDVICVLLFRSTNHYNLRDDDITANINLFWRAIIVSSIWWLETTQSKKGIFFFCPSPTCFLLTCTICIFCLWRCCYKWREWLWYEKTLPEWLVFIHYISKCIVMSVHLLI